MKKQTKIVIGSMILLVIAIGILLYFNGRGNGDSMAAQKERTFVIKENEGVEGITVTKEMLAELEADEFPAVVRSSGKKPVEVVYKGVPLFDVLEANKVNLEGKEQIIIKAADGYTIALSVLEVREPKNVYLVYEMDGELLKDKSQGGSGPYQVVIRRDPFSQRWCKYVSEVLV